MTTSSAVCEDRTTAPEGLDADGPAQRPSRHRSEDARLGQWVAAISALALVAVVYVLHAALPATPFRLPLENRQTIRTVVPEGWAFFTISPRTPDITVYGARADGSWRRLTTGAHFEPGTVLGLNRRARSQGTELAIVANQVPPGAWFACNREPTVCLANLKPTTTAVNFSLQRTMCGEAGLTVQEMPPWAWRGLATNMPSKVARVVIQC